VDLLNPKRVDITTRDGAHKPFVLSHFPAIQGREILTQYPLTAIPRVAEYAANEGVMLKMMSYVGVEMPDGTTLALTTQALVNNHVPDAECLMRLEAAMLEYNCSFFGSGKISTFFETTAAKARTLIAQTLTEFLQQSKARK
jgi:hypothetical protein